MDFTSITTLDDLPRLDAALPQGAIAVSGGMLYSHFRAREFPSLLGVLWGVLMWAAGDLSMKDTAAALSAAGIEVSRSALRDRIAGSASWLQLLLSMLLCGNAAFPAKEDACVRVVVGDSTSLSSPGSKGTDFRVHALFDSATGALVGAQVTDAFVGESVSHHILGAESLGQYDRGFSNARNIHAKAARGARFLIRCNPGGIRICDTNGEVMRPADMEHLVRDDAPVDVEARIPARTSAAHGPRWHKHRTVRLAQARLIGVRTPKGVLWLLTNMPAGALPAKAAGELYRRRWQIELLFKTLKGVAGLDRLKCRTDETAKAWICAKLILAGLAQKLVRPFVATEPGEPYRHSAFSRFRAAWFVVTHAVLAAAMRALISDEHHLARMRNTARKRCQQAPVMPIRIGNQALLPA